MGGWGSSTSSSTTHSLLLGSPHFSFHLSHSPLLTVDRLQNPNLRTRPALPRPPRPPTAEMSRLQGAGARRVAGCGAGSSGKPRGAALRAPHRAARARRRRQRRRANPPTPPTTTARHGELWAATRLRRARTRTPCPPSIPGRGGGRAAAHLPPFMPTMPDLCNRRVTPIGLSVRAADLRAEDHGGRPRPR